MQQVFRHTYRSNGKAVPMWMSTLEGEVPHLQGGRLVRPRRIQLVPSVEMLIPVVCSITGFEEERLCFKFTEFWCELCLNYVNFPQQVLHNHLINFFQ